MDSSIAIRMAGAMIDRLPLTLRGYRRLAAAATPFSSILLTKRLKQGKEHPTRIGERRGETQLPRPAGALIWAHGASVGEMLALLPLIERLRAKSFNVLITSGTLTSTRLAERLLPAGVIHQIAPMDAPRFIDRFLRHWRPNLALMAESELWPNLIMDSHRRGIPLILVNGRLSARSFAGWRYAPAMIASLLQRFDLCLVQSEADARRYGALGAPRVDVTGNLKLDAPAPSVSEHTLAAMRAYIGNRPVIAGASTHPGEEALVIEAHRRLASRFPGLLTILAPRHPERGEGVVEIATLAGLPAARRSLGRLPGLNIDVYVADTIGELGLVYRLAPIVFIGGSLVRHGGQNPIEAVRLGAAIAHGPHVENFGEVYASLDSAKGAASVTDAGELAACFAKWLSDAAERSAVAERAMRTVDLLGGALERTFSALEPYLMQLRLEQPE
jgi:3-deoxy-D-manno-octulosonic-acid transferase